MERIQIKIHRWNVAITTQDFDFVRVLRERLPHYFHLADSRKGSTRDIRFSFRYRWERGTGASRKKGFHSYPLRNLGVSRMIRFATNQISVVVRRQVLEDACLYHPCFLGPFCLLIRKFGATLVHGALVADEKEEGILILGRHGVGKSTLTLSFLARGFRYFSDEHPILENRGGRVLGAGFISRIALPAASATNFPSLRSLLQWSAARNKFYIDAERIPSARLGRTCLIHKVVFPRFSPTGKLSVRELRPLELFRALMEDDYFAVALRDSLEKGLDKLYLDLMGALANQARGYAIRYGVEDIGVMPKIVARL